jgi:hypothetical protein
MALKGEFSDRPDVQIAVLHALVGRSEEGMTVFELRSGVDVDIDIDELETALADLKEAGLIDVENDDEAMRIYPDDRVVPEPTNNDEDEPSVLERLRQKLGL